MILNDYEINTETSVLIPAYHFEYDTIAREGNHKLYIKKTPLQLIKEACLEGGSTYEGRRLAVIHQTGSQHKVPIPISPFEHIFAFPTHSPELHKCSWIFYHHVKSISPDPKKSRQTIITFKDGNDPLILAVSFNALQKQIQRTSYCIVRFSHHSYNHSYSDRENYFLV